MNAMIKREQFRKEEKDRNELKVNFALQPIS